MRWLLKRKDRGNGYLVENIRVYFEESGLCHHKIAAADAVHERTGHNRVRDSRRRTRGHCNPRNRHLPTQAAGALERDSRRHQQPVTHFDNERGQSTVEFAIITAGFLAATVALGTMWQAFGDGLLIEHALAVASHHIQAVAPTTIADIFLY